MIRSFRCIPTFFANQSGESFFFLGARTYNRLVVLGLQCFCQSRPRADSYHSLIDGYLRPSLSTADFSWNFHFFCYDFLCMCQNPDYLLRDLVSYRVLTLLFAFLEPTREGGRFLPFVSKLVRVLCKTRSHFYCLFLLSSHCSWHLSLLEFGLGFVR